ncbi:MAG: DNA replication/repair protein RecF [Candidatus Saccharimonadales bacterium]
MILTDLRLQQYRSYVDASFELGAGVTIVVGPNAAGKTNLLEAIMVACVGKSYRARDTSLVRRDQPWARVDVHTSDNVLRTTKLQTDPAGRLQKTFEIDGKVYKRFPVAHRQPVVLFEPNDLQLIESEPGLRRSYLDDLVEQYIPAYEQHQAHYKRVLAQRNALLKQGSRGSSQLFAWNLRLVDLGEQLVKQRLTLLATINKSIAATYTMIAKDDKKIKLHYESSIDVLNYGTNLLKKLESSVELDMARGFTGSGPHRDDVVVYFGDQPALLSASRGEIRTLLLALKIIELQVLERERGVRPLLLLDDVFSELDGARRRALTKLLKDYQTIITTTDADSVIANFSDGYSVIAI